MPRPSRAKIGFDRVPFNYRIERAAKDIYQSEANLVGRDVKEILEELAWMIRAGEIKLK